MTWQSWKWYTYSLVITLLDTISLPSSHVLHMGSSHPSFWFCAVLLSSLRLSVRVTVLRSERESAEIKSCVFFSLTFSDEVRWFWILSGIPARPSGNQQAECFLKVKNKGRKIHLTLYRGGGHFWLQKCTSCILDISKGVYFFPFLFAFATSHSTLMQLFAEMPKKSEENPGKCIS